MISISLSNITLVLGARSIFSNLNWEIQHDQKVGLIGPNGAGKSSLLKLITGEYTPEPGGSVVRAKAVSVGYCPTTWRLSLTAFSRHWQGSTCHEVSTAFRYRNSWASLGVW
jgi:ATPase subunit of ABC transporter with duplicated ATPase domains